MHYRFCSPVTRIARALAPVVCLLALVSAPARAQNTAIDPVYTFHTTLGNLKVQLYTDIAPKTVANFLAYVNSGAYNGSFIHRSVVTPTPFVWQGGGFTFTNQNGVQTIPTSAPVVNEFHLSNVRGTIAMAQVGSDPNSATDQWFFNLADNSANLDSQNGGFTVFGRVVDSASLSVMDSIAAVPVYNEGSPFDNIPLINYTASQAVQASNLVLVSAITQAASASTHFDFNGDGHNDLLWHNSSTGQVLLWNLSDQTVLTPGGPFATVADTAWSVSAVADVNGDGIPDLLWENSRTGQLSFWTMNSNGTVHTYGQPFATISDTHWHVVSMADFNGDGNPDLLWENSVTGKILVWYMNGTSVQTYGVPFATVSDTHWRVAGTADFNSDGKPDLLWENSQTGQVLVWYMGGTNGTTVTTYGGVFATVSNTAWRVAGTGDFNGDGIPDLLWENSQTGQVLRWLMGGTNGTTVQQAGSAFATVANTQWQVVGVH